MTKDLPTNWPNRSSWVAEYRFHPTRKWRFDFAHIKRKIAIEVNGGIFIRGRHTRGTGQLKDMEKFNNAQALGWFIFQFTPSQMRSGEAAIFMEDI